MVEDYLLFGACGLGGAAAASIFWVWRARKIWREACFIIWDYERSMRLGGGPHLRFERELMRRADSYTKQRPFGVAALESVRRRWRLIRSLAERRV